MLLIKILSKIFIFVREKVARARRKKFWKLKQKIDPIYTAISRKVVWKIVHATIPKGNMGYDQ